MPLWNLIPAAANLAITAANRPKKKDYKPNTGYLKKYIAHLRGQQADSQAYHMAMQPALRAIGSQNRRLNQQIGANAAKFGLSGSGIEAQQRLSAGQKTNETLQNIGEKAFAAKMAENKRLGNQVEQANMQIGQLEDQARLDYQKAKSKWQSDLVGAGVNLATAGIGAYIGKLKAGTDAFEAAKAGGILGADVTKEQFLQQAKEQGYRNPEKYFESLRKNFNDQSAFEGIKATGLTDAKDYETFKNEAQSAGFKNPMEYGKRLNYIRNLGDKFTSNYSEEFLNSNPPKGYTDFQSAIKDPKFNPNQYMKSLRTRQNRNYINIIKDPKLNFDKIDKMMESGKVNDQQAVKVVEAMLKNKSNAGTGMFATVNKLFTDGANPEDYDMLLKNANNEKEMNYILKMKKLAMAQAEKASKKNNAISAANRGIIGLQTSLTNGIIDPKNEEAKNFLTGLGDLQSLSDPNNYRNALTSLQDYINNADLPVTTDGFLSMYGMQMSDEDKKKFMSSNAKAKLEIARTRLFDKYKGQIDKALNLYGGNQGVVGVAPQIPSPQPTVTVGPGQPAIPQSAPPEQQPQTQPPPLIARPEQQTQDVGAIINTLPEGQAVYNEYLKDPAAKDTSFIDYYNWVMAGAEQEPASAQPQIPGPVQQPATQPQSQPQNATIDSLLNGQMDINQYLGTTTQPQGQQAPESQPQPTSQMEPFPQTDYSKLVIPNGGQIDISGFKTLSQEPTLQERLSNKSTYSFNSEPPAQDQTPVVDKKAVSNNLVSLRVTLGKIDSQIKKLSGKTRLTIDERKQLNELLKQKNELTGYKHQMLDSYLQSIGQY